MSETAIVFRNIAKKFNESSYYAVDHVHFSVKEGEFITILGSSGSGKTNLA